MGRKERVKKTRTNRQTNQQESDGVIRKASTTKMEDTVSERSYRYSWLLLGTVNIFAVAMLIGLYYRKYCVYTDILEAFPCFFHLNIYSYTLFPHQWVSPIHSFTYSLTQTRPISGFTLGI